MGPHPGIERAPQFILANPHRPYGDFNPAATLIPAVLTRRNDEIRGRRLAATGTDTPTHTRTARVE